MAPRLIVTVDHGIASHDGVAAAAARGIEVLITDHHLPAATLPVPRADRQSEPARMRLSGQAPRRRRRHVLRAARHARGVARAGPFRRPRAAESRHAARSRRARHGGRRRLSRPDQPDAGRAGARAHPRRPRTTGRRRAARGRRSRRAAGDRLRPGLRRGSAPQRGGTAFRHVARHPLPSRRQRGGSGCARRGARPAQSRTPRRRSHDAGRRARCARGARRRCRACRRVHALPVRPRVASGRGRHRRGTAQGPLSPAGHRVRAGKRRRAQGIGPVDRRIPSARRARPRREARTGAAREVRRARVRRRTDARRIGPAEIRRALRGDRPGAAVGGRPRAHARIGRSARAGGARDRARVGAVAPKSGDKASPPRCSTTPSPCSTSGSSADTTRSCRCPGATSASTRSCSATSEPLPRAIRAAYRPDVNEWRGETSLQLVILHWQQA